MHSLERWSPGLPVELSMVVPHHKMPPWWSAIHRGPNMEAQTKRVLFFSSELIYQCVCVYVLCVCMWIDDRNKGKKIFYYYYFCSQRLVNPLIGVVLLLLFFFHFFHIKKIKSKGCQANATPPTEGLKIPLSGGWVFTIIILCSFALYCGCGICYNKVLTQEPRWRDSIPCGKYIK